MENVLKNLLTVSAMIILTAAAAQPAKRDFREVDEFVKKLGSLDSMNTGTISAILTRKFTDNTDKVRAIFDWVAFNISIDCKAVKNGNNVKVTGDDVLKTRKATGAGFAALFQDMCSVAKIRCLTVDGYAKNRPEQIDEKPDEFNHTWAVVQLGQSPDTWHYVDPTWASGYTDEKFTTFTRSFNDAYFFAEKPVFNYQHFPDNSAWQLGNGSKSLKDFISLPVVRDAAYEYGFLSFLPYPGTVKAKAGKPVKFNLTIRSTTKVDIVSLEFIKNKKRLTKTVDYTYQNGSISFSYNFDDADNMPVSLLVNNKPVLTYMFEISD